MPEKTIREVEEVEGMIPTIPKKEQYSGPFSLRKERKNLLNEQFDSLNFEEKLNRPFGVLNSLDTGIRTTFDIVRKREKELKKITESSAFKEQDWSDSKWFNLYQEKQKSVNDLEAVASYKDWQIEFLFIMVEKLREALRSVKGASEERIVVKTIREILQEDREQTKMLMSEMRRDRDREAKETREWMRTYMTEMAKVMGFKDGAKLLQKDKEIKEKEDEIKRLRQKLGEEKEEIKEPSEGIEIEKPPEKEKEIEVPIVEADDELGKIVFDFIKRNPRKFGKNEARDNLMVETGGEFSSGDIYEKIVELEKSGVLKVERNGFKHLLYV